MAAYLLAVLVPTWVVVLGGIALALLSAFILSGIFGPMPAYSIPNRGELPGNDSEEFLKLLESLADADGEPLTARLRCSRMGDHFYPAELEAMRGARKSICLEAYIFQKSEIGRLYVDAMTERARAGRGGERAAGCGWQRERATRDFFRPLLDAGGRLELVQLAGVVPADADGQPHAPRVAGCGWQYRLHRRRGRRRPLVSRAYKGTPRWRDTMVRVEG